jgi:hypothetical protein
MPEEERPTFSTSKARADTEDTRATARVGRDANGSSTRVTLEGVGEIPGHHNPNALPPRGDGKVPASAKPWPGPRTIGHVRWESWKSAKITGENPYAPSKHHNGTAGTGKNASAHAAWGDEPPKRR